MVFSDMISTMSLIPNLSLGSAVCMLPEICFLQLVQYRLSIVYFVAIAFAGIISSTIRVYESVGLDSLVWHMLHSFWSIVMVQSILVGPVSAFSSVF